MARAQQRCVLALLAINAGRAVPVSTLVDRLWGDQPPPSAVHSLHAHVSRLRQVLAQADSTTGLHRAGDGYRLDIRPDHVDLHRARRLVSEARAVPATAGDRDQQMLRRLRAATTLWRGTPLAGLTGDWPRQARGALMEERLSTFIERFRIELRLGGHDVAVAPLTALLADHPLAEALAGLKMLALYRCGRQADALDVYRQLRARVVAEIGDEPGAELQALHEQILRRDPDLGAPAAGDHSGTPDPAAGAGAHRAPRPALVVPRELPPDLTGFTGRTAQLARLEALLQHPGGQVLIVAVSGIPGVGKTSLAVHWAHRIRNRFPDGQLFIDLRGYAACPPANPSEVLTRLLPTFGVPPERIPDREDDAVAVYRSLVADKKLLLVLDDAASAEQVRPLLPGGNGSMVLVTSRHQLTGLMARDGALRMHLGELPPDEAQALLSRSLADDRTDVKPESVRQLAEVCGYLPLALRIAAANLAVHPGRTVSELVSQLRTNDRLGVLTVPDDPRAAVRAAFDLSYLRLPETTRRVFRYLGLATGPDMDVEAVAALAGLEVTQARRHLDVLTSAHFVQEMSSGRYTLHDLLRVYANERAHREEPEAARAAAQTRIGDHWLCHVNAAMELLQPGMVRLPLPAATSGTVRHTFDGADAALAWLEAERSNLVAAARDAAATGRHPVAWLLADALRGYFFMCGHTADWHNVATTGLAAATARGDPCGQAAAELSLSYLRLRQGRNSEAVAHAKSALRHARRGGWESGQMAGHNALGAAYIESGQLEKAADHLHRVATTARATGQSRGEASALGNLALICRDRGRLFASAKRGRRALELNNAVGSCAGQGRNHYLLGDVYHRLGNVDLGLHHYHEAALCFRKVGDGAFEGLALCGLATINRDTGDPAEALRLADAGLALVRDSGREGIEADALTVRSSVRCLRGDRAVIDECRRAVDIAQAHCDRYVEANALMGLATAHHLHGAPDEALAQVAHAMTICEDAGFRLLRGEALTLFAAIRLGSGDAAAALEYGRRALRIHRETGFRLGEGRTLLVLGAALACAEHSAEAYRHRQRAVAVLTSLRVPVDDQVRILLATVQPPATR